MKKVCQFRIEEVVLDQFKEYCDTRDTTMSKILVDYITTLLPKTFNCEWCGKDLTGMSKQNSSYHRINCEKHQKE